MQHLHTSRVLPQEIDGLGHMNVRYYLARMETANRTLIDGLHLDAEALGTDFLRRVDTYTRFKREQFEGATLHTLGAVIEINERGIQSYVEVRNPDTQETAATFILTTALTDQSTRKNLPFPQAAYRQEKSSKASIPSYAQPRSLTLDTLNTHVTLSELEACIPQINTGGMMSGQLETLVEETDTDVDGWLREDLELMFLPFAKMAQNNSDAQGPPVFHTADGRRVGWAVMESRTHLFGLPRLGQTLAYFSADLRVDTKSRLSRRWAFARDSQQLLGISDTVGVCVDLDARRAIAWPDELRQQIEQNQQPQLA
ncbi:MAG: acyl-ACP thioesterase [Gammaproteobacteria bacterium]|jgi:acyl-CoA thioester hydrolase|nr:acyl-ACP thioesterase [Gammaproteobacteria bacterium]